MKKSQKIISKWSLVSKKNKKFIANKGKILKNKKKLGLISVMLFICFLNPCLSKVPDTPTPTPYVFVRDPLTITGAELQMKNITIELNCYTDRIEGVGNYLIENVANNSVCFKIGFHLWDWNFEIKKSLLNNSELNFSNEISLNPHQTLLILIQWKTSSYLRDIGGKELWFTESDRDLYFVYYQIDTTEYLGGTILFEQLRFNFYSDRFYNSDLQSNLCRQENLEITSKEGPNNLLNNSEKIQLLIDQVPYYEISQENINQNQAFFFYSIDDNTHITWFNTLLVILLGVGAIFLQKVIFIMKAKKAGITAFLPIIVISLSLGITGMVPYTEKMQGGGIGIPITFTPQPLMKIILWELGLLLLYNIVLIVIIAGTGIVMLYKKKRKNYSDKILNTRKL